MDSPRVAGCISRRNGRAVRISRGGCYTYIPSNVVFHGGFDGRNGTELRAYITRIPLRVLRAAAAAVRYWRFANKAYIMVYTYTTTMQAVYLYNTIQQAGRVAKQTTPPPPATPPSPSSDFARMTASADHCSSAADHDNDGDESLFIIIIYDSHFRSFVPLSTLN